MKKRSPSYEVLVLVSDYLDPKTIAIASCICKSWFKSLSSDHLWEPICTKNFPSITHLRLTAPTVSYHRLYAIGYTANKRRFRTPPKPKLSPEDLVFSINIIFNTKFQKNMVCLVKPLKELVYDPKGIFKFELSVKEDSSTIVKEEDKNSGIKIVWNVILKGWRGVFTMMECEGKAVQEWFSEELPLPGSYSSIVGGCILADFKLGICSGNERVISLGIMSAVSWRYLTMDDGLRYLQYFLMP